MARPAMPGLATRDRRLVPGQEVFRKFTAHRRLQDIDTWLLLTAFRIDGEQPTDWSVATRTVRVRGEMIGLIIISMC